MPSRPRDVRVANRLFAIPGDEVCEAVSGLFCEPAERQELVDVGDVAWLELTDRHQSPTKFPTTEGATPSTDCEARTFDHANAPQHRWHTPYERR
jgi:hypothetical protein